MYVFSKAKLSTLKVLHLNSHHVCMYVARLNFYCQGITPKQSPCMYVCSKAKLLYCQGITPKQSPCLHVCSKAKMSTVKVSHLNSHHVCMYVARLNCLLSRYHT